MGNRSYENDFDLHENEIACRTNFHQEFCTQTRFETEVQEDSEMAPSSLKFLISNSLIINDCAVAVKSRVHYRISCWVHVGALFKDAVFLKHWR